MAAPSRHFDARIGWANWDDDPPDLAEKLVQQWRNVESIEAFQERGSTLSAGLMSKTTEGVTWDGPPEAFQEGMLFLSNHRDIVLDPSLLNVALLEEERDRRKSALGPTCCRGHG